MLLDVFWPTAQHIIPGVERTSAIRRKLFPLAESPDVLKRKPINWKIKPTMPKTRPVIPIALFGL